MLITGPPSESHCNHFTLSSKVYRKSGFVDIGGQGHNLTKKKIKDGGHEPNI